MRPSSHAVLFTFLAVAISGCGGGDDTESAVPADQPDAADAAGGHDAQPDVAAPDAQPDVAAPDASLDAQPDADDQDADGADALADGPTEAEPDADAALPLTGCVSGSFNPYWGNLHAHTSYSDGEQEPSDAFAYARDVAGLDIMVVTDHLEQLYWMPPLDRWGECNSQADAAYLPGTFLATCGFEYGSGFILPTFESTGHANVFFAPSLFPAVQTDFHQFYDSLVLCPTCIAQFNHPGDEPKQTFHDFEYIAAADDKLNLMEFNGGGATWVLFLEALDAGWHVSPMDNQDNHSANWGTANDKRSGLYMSDLTRAALGEAMANRRTFMTEDKNASIRMMANDVCWMGSILGQAPSLDLKVVAGDADAGDGFETIELYGPGGATLGTFDCQGQQSCEATFPVTPAGSTWFVARALQSDGAMLVAAPIWASP